MLLYSGMTPDFVLDTTRNAIAGRLAQAFERHFRYSPSENEYRSWQNSLRALAAVVDHARLLDQGIILEYQLPLSSRRLDAMLMGRRESGDRAVIVELKQWDEAEKADAPDLVRTWVGGGRRDVLHPSVQVNQYRRYLQDTHTAFHADAAPVSLDACAYLHNYTSRDGDPLFSDDSEAVRQLAPVFTGPDALELGAFLSDRLSLGDGERVMRRVETSKYRPARKLLAHVAKVVNEEPAFVLLDEQLVVFNQVMAAVDAARTDSRRHVFIVHGGPGTGKSVLAVNLLGELSRKGINAHHATGSKAFTRTLQRIVGREAARQFRYFNNFGRAEPGEVDVLLCDEAHRIRSSSNHRFTRKADLSTRTQIQELLEAARVTVFFIDDQQVVRPNEIGKSSLIREAAESNGCVLHESVLEAQFRCSGSDAFVGWVDNTLEVRRAQPVLFDQSEQTFEFNIIESAHALDALIRGKAAEGHSARLVAGYCWPWSKTLDEDGALSRDVAFDSFQRPWNARPEMTGLPPGVPKADYWAHEAGGLDQVGCIYTAQGFEFDYVGVIWGLDLRYQPGEGWVGDKNANADSTVKRSGDRFVELLKNTYRVLLSRGMKGCFVHFLDPETEKFVRSRTEGLGARPKPAPERSKQVLPSPELPDVHELTPFVRIPAKDIRPWENCVPLLDLQIAAGSFGELQELESDAIDWVALPDHVRVRPGQFVARVVGESMNRRVPNGAWALFSTDVRGSKQGKIVLARAREFGDPEDAGRFTLKTYDAAKVESDEGAVYERISLHPSSTDPRYARIDIDLDDEERPMIVALLVTVLV